MSSFLSEPWLDEASAALAPVDTQIAGSHAVSYQHPDEDLGFVQHSQRWQDGRLANWVVGPLTNATAVVRLDLWAAYLWLRGEPAPSAEINVIDSTGVEWSLPPTPAQLARTCGESFEGASVDVVVTIADHPLGPTERRYSFRDGKPDELQIGVLASAPPLKLALPFGGSAGFLLGGVPFRDLAAASKLDGNILSLGCLAGMLAPPGVDRNHSDAHEAVRHASAALVATSVAVPLLRELMDRTPAP